MSQIVDAFPGSDDAGKAIDWLTRQIFETSLGKGLKSRPSKPHDAQMIHQRDICHQVEPQSGSEQSL